MKTAYLLIAHGSRNREANQDLVFVAEQLRIRAGGELVQPSYLELAEPTIGEGGQRLVEQGAERVVLVPYFLSPGRHALQDLQHHRNLLAERYPKVQFLLAPPLGRHPLLVEIVFQRIHEATLPTSEPGPAFPSP